MMLSKSYIEEFCDRHDYRISKSNIARWIDQKCAADVLTIVADCILNYIRDELNDLTAEFSSKDIWKSSYASENIPNIFKKPNVDRPTAQKEYDKFFQQPMELFSFAGILYKRKDGNKNIYKVNNIEMLDYIALRERNALLFLCIYIEKVLQNNNLLSKFQVFFNIPNQDNYSIVKTAFSLFTIMNTRINGITECNRIFIKIINPLAYYKNTFGTEMGRISTKKITYDMLMYNRDNFRDIYSEKPRDTPRSEYITTNRIYENENYYKYQSP